MLVTPKSIPQRQIQTMKTQSTFLIEVRLIFKRTKQIDTIEMKVEESIVLTIVKETNRIILIGEKNMDQMMIDTSQEKEQSTETDLRRDQSQKTDPGREKERDPKIDIGIDLMNVENKNMMNIEVGNEAEVELDIRSIFVYKKT